MYITIKILLKEGVYNIMWLHEGLASNNSQLDKILLLKYVACILNQIYIVTLNIGHVGYLWILGSSSCDLPTTVNLPKAPDCMDWSECQDKKYQC